jgi:hypothetical protein
MRTLPSFGSLFPQFLLLWTSERAGKESIFVANKGNDRRLVYLFSWFGFMRRKK